MTSSSAQIASKISFTLTKMHHSTFHLIIISTQACFNRCRIHILIIFYNIACYCIKYIVNDIPFCIDSQYHKLIEISSLHYFQVATPLIRFHKVLCRRLSKSTLSSYYDHFDSLILPLFQGLFYVELINLSCFMHVIDFILKGLSIDIFTTRVTSSLPLMLDKLTCI